MHGLAYAARLDFVGAGGTFTSRDAKPNGLETCFGTLNCYHFGQALASPRRKFCVFVCLFETTIETNYPTFGLGFTT